MSIPVVIGIDPGTRHMGICVLIPGKGITLKEYIPNLKQDVTQRIWEISQWFHGFLRQYWNSDYAPLVVFEGISYGGKNYTGKQALYELLGVLKNECKRYALPFMQVPPSTLKKWFTGSGKASKEDMLFTAKERLRDDYKNCCVNALTDNEADAFALALYGVKHFEAKK